MLLILTINYYIISIKYGFRKIYKSIFHLLLIAVKFQKLFALDKLDQTFAFD